MVVFELLLKQEQIAERLDAKVLPNKDIYNGEFKGILPHGNGKYTWTDGTVYEGEWEEGKMTGKGQIIWSSGAKYEGDFCGGYLHGFGTLTGPDGSEYRGAWRMNIQHGHGKKEYANSDFYEGLWKEGMREGNGKYSWNIGGHTYTGNWKGGKMNGQGVMKWENGDLFDGYWSNGLRDGSGVYKFADGGCYFGSWSKGLKDGKGTFYPPGTKLRSLNSLSHSSSLESVQGVVPKPSVTRSFSAKKLVGGILRSSGQPKCGTNPIDDKFAPSHTTGESICNEPSHMLSQASDIAQKDLQGIIYEREYMQEVLFKERVRIIEKSRKSKQKLKFHVKVIKKPHVDNFEAQKSYYLMLNLQLGIRYTLGKITPLPMREVRASDFGDSAAISMYFPRMGSHFTPPHYSVDFYWQDYRPMVFRNLKEMFKLDAAEYMMSICGDDGLRELSSAGKSGSLFYLSHDDRFVIKTLKKSELKLLLKMLPNYYDHVVKHENTLITKFFGVHRIILKGGRKIRFVVMGNMFCTELKIHRCYDLKGSTQGRFTDADKMEANKALKDLDLTYEFQMDKLLRESLFKQLSEDCHFLESQHIIDYSLLLGLHFRAPEQLKAILQSAGAMPNIPENLPFGDGITSQVEPLISTGLLLVTHEPSFVNTAPGPHIRGNNLRAHSAGAKEVDLLLPGTARLRVQLGVNMPAQASRKHQQEVNSMEVELFEIYDVVLYMGIIDILQGYNFKKKIENKFKSLKYDGSTISAVEPKLYADRFLKLFQQKVFAEQP
ncbi:phosphatidylinositol 4-phosphate 5-kinase 7-like [Mercurialis annua]|uniref:phosphatidylinositol 4-phosphate 5-kinase 7-like n=1 Tax=Mercurialis annua TaxID=3986 RepID=UPI00215EFAFE|nr:phosphatidylinositol 4-phosphate 5-kinase 7-like [Mercurialis annua]